MPHTYTADHNHNVNNNSISATTTAASAKTTNNSIHTKPDDDIHGMQYSYASRRASLMFFRLAARSLQCRKWIGIPSAPFFGASPCPANKHKTNKQTNK